MASAHKLLWLTVLLALTVPRQVLPAPASPQERPLAEAAPSEQEKEVKEELIEAQEVNGQGNVIDKTLEDETVVDDVEELQEPGDQPDAPVEDQGEEEEEEGEEELAEEVVEEGPDGEEVLEEEDVVEDTEDDAAGDGVDGRSSEPEATDYIWEPSFNYDSAGESQLSPWFLYDLPADPAQWSSNAGIFTEEEGSFPYYDGSSYESASSAAHQDDDGGNEVAAPAEGALGLGLGPAPASPAEVFRGVPGEELNNRLDQAVDEILCLLGLCDDGRAHPEDGSWEAEEQGELPNEIRFREEGEMGYEPNQDELQEEEEVGGGIAVPGENLRESDLEATESAEEVGDEKVPAPPKAVARHRSKRDLSWDELENDNDLLDDFNALRAVEEVEEEGDGGLDSGLTAADRFDELIRFFKAEAAQSQNGGDGFYLGVPAGLFDEEADEDEGEIREAGDFVGGGDGNEEDEDEDENWGAYAAQGAPVIQDTLKYDGFKRDDEREALKVYIESLQNMEGYRKRSEQGGDESRSVSSFLRQLVPRSPPNAVRRPKTGLEPFAREKYFPVFPKAEGMTDDDDGGDLDDREPVYPDPNEVLRKYNELMELLDTEIEAAALISTIQEMAAEIDRDQALLRRLEAEEEADEELEALLTAGDTLGPFDVGVVAAEDEEESDSPRKRSPRVVDYPDFNEYPPEFHRSAPMIEPDQVSEEDLARLYLAYLDGEQEGEEEGEDGEDEEENAVGWGDIYDPRDRREGEDSLPGPYGGYYVQGRMMARLMHPKRSWEPTIGEGDEEKDREVVEEEENQPLEDLSPWDSEQPYIVLEPADLGYEEWPGDFDVLYDTRDGTFLMYPFPGEEEAAEAPRQAPGQTDRNAVDDGEGWEAMVQEVGEWQDAPVREDDLLKNLQELNADLDQLESLSQLLKMVEGLRGEGENRDGLADTLEGFYGK